MRQPLVILRVAKASYDDIRARVIAAGASDMLLAPRTRGEPERINMGEIALEAERE
jgi:hypothetical protein